VTGSATGYGGVAGNVTQKKKLRNSLRNGGDKKLPEKE
jgi:hypothetical protein